MLALVGAGNALIDLAGFTLLARLSPANVLARVFGVLESLVALSVGLGGVVTPLVIDALDLRTALVVLGLVTPVAIALTWVRLRALDAGMRRRDEELQLLRGVALLEVLPLPALETIARQLDHVVVPAGEAVFHQGDPGDRFYVVVEGTATVEGDGSAITTLGPGDSFGEIALLRRVPRTATVRADEDLRLESLRGDRFVAVMTGSRRGDAAASAHVDEMLRPVRPPSRARTPDRTVTGAARRRDDGAGGRGPWTSSSACSRRSPPPSPPTSRAPVSTTSSSRCRRSASGRPSSRTTRPKLPAMEHRYLNAILMLNRIDCDVVFVCSREPPPEVLAAYEDIVTPAVAARIRERLHLVVVDDLGPRPLAAKLLDRPDLLDEIRERVAGRVAVIEPWNVTDHEVAVALALGLPINGTAPALRSEAFKAAGRCLFRRTGVPVPVGVEGVHTVDDVVDAVARIRSERPDVAAVVVKHDDSGAGDGNTVVELTGPSGAARTPSELRATVAALPGVVPRRPPRRRRHRRGARGR